MAYNLLIGCKFIPEDYFYNSLRFFGTSSARLCHRFNMSIKDRHNTPEPLNDTKLPKFIAVPLCKSNITSNVFDKNLSLLMWCFLPLKSDDSQLINFIFGLIVYNFDNSRLCDIRSNAFEKSV